jgi:hypothetical protein
VLGHLSEENNHPDKALKQAAMALHAAGVANRVQVRVGCQDHAIEPITIGTRAG